MTSLWKISVQNRLHKVPTNYRFQRTHLLPEFKTLHCKTKQKRNLRPSLPTNYTHFRASNYFTDSVKQGSLVTKVSTGCRGWTQYSQEHYWSPVCDWLEVAVTCSSFSLGSKASTDFSAASAGKPRIYKRRERKEKKKERKKKKKKTEQKKKGQKRGRWACGAQQHPILYAPNQVSLLPNGINVKLFTVL